MEAYNKGKKTKFFIIGIVFVYICLLIIPSVYFYPLPFLILFIISLKYFNDFRKALYITSVFTIPYFWGYSFSFNSLIKAIFSFPGLIFILSLFSLRKTVSSRFILPAVLLLFFLLWGILSFVLVNTTSTVLNGLLYLILSILLYFISQIYLKEPRVKEVLIIILFSIIIFESILAIMQFMVGHPIGLFIEEGLDKFPFGRLASEDKILFRPSGSFDEPTWFARFITILFPLFLFKFKLITLKNKFLLLILLSLCLVAIIVSWTRFSIFVIIGLLFLTKFRASISNIVRGKKSLLFIIPLYFFLLLYLFPYLYQRISTSFISFDEMGSFSVRIKLIQEAVSLIETYPVFGVGLRQFQVFALDNNITNVFQNIYIPVHNVYLLIASEMGIPALFIFLGFIYFCYKSYFVQKNKLKTNSDDSNINNFAALGGLIYLIESSMGTTFLSSHFIIFLLYMSIITI